ncbi:MAG: WD40/YVTN/BNR-like repeat-containing protein, partial [bacterium]
TNRGKDWIEISQDHFQTFALLVDPRRSNILYNGKVYFGVSRSLDGGVTWTEVNEGLTHSNVLELAFHPSNPDIVYAGTTKGGIYRADFSKLHEAAQTSDSTSGGASDSR